MNGTSELADRAQDEQQALEALTALSESQRAKPAVHDANSLSAQRQVELLGRFGRIHSELPQQPGFTQQPGYRGICYNRKSGRWLASITAHGRSISLGAFDSEEEAARVFDRTALRIRGHKAALNFPPADYLLPDGTLALDLQAEALLMEAFLGRGSASGNNERDGADAHQGQQQQQQQPSNSSNGSGAAAAGDEASGSAAAIGDLVRQCLGRINRADRADLQEAAEALGPGYLRLMGLITDAGQVLAAGGGGDAGSGGARQKLGGEGVGGGESGAEGGADDWVLECRDNRPASSSQQQLPASWQGPRGGGVWAGAAALAGGGAEHARTRGQVRQQQQHQQVKEQPHHQQQHQQHQQHTSQKQQRQQQHDLQLLQHHQHQLQLHHQQQLQQQQHHQQQKHQQQKQKQQPPDAHDKSRASQLPTHAKEEQQQQEHQKQEQQQQQRDVFMEDSLAAQDPPERGRPPRNQLEPAGGSGAAAPTDSEALGRATVFAGDVFPPAAAAEREQGPGPPAATAGAAGGSAPTYLPPNLMQGLCNLLASHVQQARQQQQPAEETASRPPPPPVVQAVAQLIASGFPAGLLLQAAEHLAASKLVPCEDFEALEAAAAWLVSERGGASGSAPGHRAATAASAVATGTDGPQATTAAALRGPQQTHHQQQHRQQQQQQHEQRLPSSSPQHLETLMDSGGGGGGMGTSGPSIARSGSGVGRKRKPADAATVTAAVAAAAGGRGEPPPPPLAAAAAGVPGVATGYGGIDDVPPTAKRQHRQRMQEAALDSQYDVPPGAASAADGPSGRAAGVDAAAAMDTTTSIAMAAAAAAASTAGGVPIGIPTAPKEQARAAAAVAAAAAAAALAAPISAAAPPPPRAAQMMYMSTDGGMPPASAALMHHAGGNLARGGGGGPGVSTTTGGGVSGPVRQHIGLGRRLFHAIASQLPPGAELDCLLPPRYGFVGVLYGQPGSTRVGAALWDGGEVRDLGVYSSDRDARQSFDSTARLMSTTMGQPSTAAPQPSAAAAAAAAAARHLPAAAATGGGGGMLMSKPSVMTSGTAGLPQQLATAGSIPEISYGGMAAAATAAARSKLSGPPMSYHGPGLYKTTVGSGGGGGCSSVMTSGLAAATVPRTGTGRAGGFATADARDGPSLSSGSPSGGVPVIQGISGGGGSGSGAPTMLIRPLSGGGGGGCSLLAPAASTRSLLSGSRSALAPPLQGAAAAAAALQVGGAAAVRGSSKHDQALPRGGSGTRGPAATAAVMCSGELETVGSSLPKGPVLGPFLVGTPELSKDGSLQLVCQLFVQQDEPLSPDDLNNVIAQKFTAANLQNLLQELAGSEAAVATAAATATAAAAREPSLAAGGGAAAAMPATTITTCMTGTTTAGDLASQGHNRHHHNHPHHHYQPPPQHPVQNRNQQLGVTPRAPYPVIGGGGGTAIPLGSPPMPFALRGAGPLMPTPLERERDGERQREREESSPLGELNDAASVRGPLLLPSSSRQLQHQHEHGQLQPAKQLLPTSGSRKLSLPAGAPTLGPPVAAAAGGGSGGGAPMQRPRQHQLTPAAGAAAAAPALVECIRERDVDGERSSQLQRQAAAAARGTSRGVAKNGSGGSADLGASGGGLQAFSHMLPLQHRYSTSSSSIRAMTVAASAAPTPTAGRSSSAAAAAVAAAAVAAAAAAESELHGAGPPAAVAAAAGPPPSVMKQEQRQSLASCDEFAVGRSGGGGGGGGATDAEDDEGDGDSGEEADASAGRRCAPAEAEFEPEAARPPTAGKAAGRKAAGDMEGGEPVASAAAAAAATTTASEGEDDGAAAAPARNRGEQLSLDSSVFERRARALASLAAAAATAEEEPSGMDAADGKGSGRDGPTAAEETETEAAGGTAAVMAGAEGWA